MSGTDYKPTLLIDFDGVIHGYTSGWKGACVVADPPVPGAFEFLRRAGHVFDVQIYSSRSKEPGGVDAMREWFYRHGFEPTYELKFPTEKPAAFLTIDDRAICFDGDWSKLQMGDLINFRPWNKR